MSQGLLWRSIKFTSRVVVFIGCRSGVIIYHLHGADETTPILPCLLMVSWSEKLWLLSISRVLLTVAMDCLAALVSWHDLV